MTHLSQGALPDPTDSVLALLASLFAAHRAGDKVLERLIERRLQELGAVCVLPTTTTTKEDHHDER